MGLETATYVNDLVTTNPASSDKKNVGDDHLRLLKSVLKTTFPNADRIFRFPETVAKSADYSILIGDDNKTIICDTTSAFTLTLPATGSLWDGWIVRVMKTTTDVNPVYVAPASGTINGLAKARCNVPFVEFVFMWTGSVWVRIKAPGEARAGTLEAYGGSAAPVGYAFPIGQSLVRADYPELFAEWSTTWGAGSVPGTTFAAPDTRNKMIMLAGGTYALASTGGAATVTLTTAKLPAHSHTESDHLHSNGGAANKQGTVTEDAGGGNLQARSAAGSGGNIWYGDASNTGAIVGGSAGSTGNTGGGEAHENLPPYLTFNGIFRLC